MTFTNDAKAVIALTTRLGTRDRPSLGPAAWHSLASNLSDRDLTPSAVFDRSFDAADFSGTDPTLTDRLEVLLGDAPAALLEADELVQKGVWILTAADDDHPEQLRLRLDSNAPPVLFGVGEQALLDGTGVGIVGSRDVSVEGAGVAKDVARRAASLARTVVSGGAKGVDQLAMNSAFGSGGRVLGVLADSLETRIRRPEILGALDNGRVCLVTQQLPSAGFSPATAMGRNKLIYGLSTVTVIVASDLESGGTWAGATEALRTGNGVVAVWRGEGEGPGNQELQRRGAHPLTAPDELEELFRIEVDASSEQLTLLD